MNLIEGEAAKAGVFTAGELSFDLPEHLADWDGPGHLRRAARGCAHRRRRRRAASTSAASSASAATRSIHLEAGGNWIKALWHRSGGGLTAAARMKGTELER